MKKFASRLLTLAAIAIMPFAFAACNSNNNENGETNGGGNGYDNGGTSSAVVRETLIMATSADFPPFEFVNDAGEFDGFDIHMARAIADILDMDLRIDDMDFGAVIMAVYTGAADVAIAALTVTEERRQSVNFTTSYFETALVAIVRQDSDITSTAQLHESGIAVAVQLGTTSDLMVEWYLEDAEVVRLRTATDTIMELNTNQVDAIIIDRGVAEQFIEDAPGMRILPETLAYEEYAIAVNRDNTELLNRINDAIAQMKASGEFDRIYDMFFGGE
ncbi:MAG: transporter substrate-binding domain-containing protein [Defluviitaleaceae bacterium]|nr:transporter substrate-binding domain-containing protein [Defluviitaleaceae bacterium]